MSAWQHVFDAASEQILSPGEALFRRGDDVQFVFLVRTGQLALERTTRDGTVLTLHVASKGHLLAEASLFAEAYHCDAVARAGAIVARLARATFLSAIRTSPDAALDLLAAAAREVQTQRARIEILRLRRVSDRLDAWLELYGEPGHGEWVRIADAIGVSPEALYRELARQRSIG